MSRSLSALRGALRAIATTTWSATIVEGGLSSCWATSSLQAATSRATARASPPSWLTRGSRRQTSCDVALVRGLLERSAFLPHPLEPPVLREPLLDRVGELDQVGDVVTRVAQLLWRQRPAIPLREPLPLLQLHAEQLVEQGAVAEAG